MAFGLSLSKYREGNEVLLLSGEKMKCGFQSFRIYPDGQISLKPLVVGWRDEDRRLIMVEPTDNNVVKLDMDFLRKMQLENERRDSYFEI